MRRYTISDIAQMADVSPATVSRVLANKPGVNKVKRAEILRIIEETGYYPSSVARSLVSGRSNIVGLIVRDLENQYYSSMAVAMQKYLMEKDYMMMVISIGVNSNASEKKDYVTEICQKFDFAGLLISVPSSDDLVTDNIRNCRCPIVTLNRTFDMACDQVTQNDFQAGYLAGSYLQELGHESFMILTGPIDTSASCRFRTEGFIQSLAANGWELDEDNMISGALSMESGYEIGCKLIEERYPLNFPTSVFINGNSIALGFLKACGELGVRIPEDLSIITVDNPQIMDLPGINLTTVSVAMDQMAKEAVDVLLEHIQTKREKKRFVALQPRLIARGSTSAPKRVYEKV